MREDPNIDRDRTLQHAEEALEARDHQTVIALLTPLAERGDCDAQFILGYLYFVSSDYPPGAAYDWLTKAAEQGHAVSLYYLARFPSSPDFVPPRSESDFVELMIKAAELGSVKAQYDLGAYYATGDWPGPKDEAEAVRWYTKAAEQGNAEAQYNLGFMLLEGCGTAQDYQEGLEWLRKAAGQRHQQALRLLVDIYREGRFGIAQDADKVQYWESLLPAH